MRGYDVRVRPDSFKTWKVRQSKLDKRAEQWAREHGIDLDKIPSNPGDEWPEEWHDSMLVGIMSYFASRAGERIEEVLTDATGN